MRARWSFRAPVAGASGWGSERAHLLAWALSVRLARAHYGRAALVTDVRGRAVLADALALPFDEVIDLDGPADAPARLVALAMQAEPFLRLDPDVFLWRPLPLALTRAPLFAQNPVAAPPTGGAAENAPSPPVFPARWPAWLRRVAVGNWPAAFDTSFLGANFVAFIARFAQDALSVFDGTASPADASLLEGSLLAAWLAYHRVTGGDEATEIVYLFESAEAAAEGERAATVGYTRLGPAGRSDSDLAQRLERRVARDYPDDYRRCLRLLAAWRGW